MPVKDWANEGDVAYARWKYSVKMGFDYAAAEAATPELVVEAASIISELAVSGDHDHGPPSPPLPLPLSLPPVANLAIPRSQLSQPLLR